MKYDVVVAGYTCVDLRIEFGDASPRESLSDWIIPGGLTEIGGLGFSLGGVVPNTGLAMKKFGMKVFLNGLTGEDFIGRIARERFEQYDAGEGIRSAAGEGTALSLVMAPPGIDRIFLEAAGCSRIFNNGHIDFEAVSRSRLFHFGYPPLLRNYYINDGQQLIELFSRIRKMGVITSLDFSLPDPESESGRVNWKRLLDRLLPLIDVFTPSLEEAIQLMNPLSTPSPASGEADGDTIGELPFETICDLGRQITGAGTRILLLKAGHHGACLFTGEVSPLNEYPGTGLNEKEWSYRALWCRAYPADPGRVKDSCGTGDTSTAAFLTALLKGEQPDSALQYAAVAGRDKLYCPDPFAELGTWQELGEEIKTEPNDIVDLKSWGRNLPPIRGSESEMLKSKQNSEK